jgi:uncharacterized membrane protein
MLLRAINVAAALAYPLLAFVVLTLWGVAALGAVTLAAGALRLVTSLRPLGSVGPGPETLSGAATGILLLALGAVMLWRGDDVGARLYPAMVNGLLLAVFVASLVHPPSAIERVARLQDPDLPEYAVAYTRRVTQVWCGFFLGNGLVALYTAIHSPLEIWTLYNGLIAYLLMGIVFAAEYAVRLRVRAAHEVPGD